MTRASAAVRKNIKNVVDGEVVIVYAVSYMNRAKVMQLDALRKYNEQDYKRIMLKVLDALDALFDETCAAAVVNIARQRYVHERSLLSAFIWVEFPPPSTALILRPCWAVMRRLPWT